MEPQSPPQQRSISLPKKALFAVIISAVNSSATELSLAPREVSPAANKTLHAAPQGTNPTLLAIRFCFSLKRFNAAEQTYQQAIREAACPLRTLPEMRPDITNMAAQHNIKAMYLPKTLDDKTEASITGDE